MLEIILINAIRKYKLHGSFKDYELIIIDDCSTASGLDILEDLKRF